MAVDTKDPRIGIVEGKKPRVNLAGKPFRGPSLQRNIIAGQGGKMLWVAMDRVKASFDSIGALRELGFSEREIDHAMKTYTGTSPHSEQEIDENADVAALSGLAPIGSNYDDEEVPSEAPKAVTSKTGAATSTAAASEKP